jgi:hypothetical protein
MTLPNPNAQHFKEVKLGNVDFELVMRELEDMMEKLESAQKTCVLPEVVDKKWMNEYLLSVYQSFYDK